MSHLTPCNYCSLQGIKSRAKAKGLYVTLCASGRWIAIFVHPREVDPIQYDAEGKLIENEYWHASCLVLTDHCVC